MGSARNTTGKTITSPHGGSSRIAAMVAIICAALSIVGCLGEASSPALAVVYRAVSALAGDTCGDNYLDEISSSFRYEVDSLDPGSTTGLRVEMTFPEPFSAPTLTTYLVEITVPSEFTFLGFDALGVATQIGAWEFDWSLLNGMFDGADFTIPHRGIDSDSAYSDSDDSGTYTPGVDPTAEYTVGTGGAHIITLTLPDGGIDQDFYGMCSYFAFDARYTLLDGILQLPSTPGNYSIEIAATSVDLDTGNATDNIEPHPLTYNDTFVVAVPEPVPTQLLSVSLVTLAGLAAHRRRRR